MSTNTLDVVTDRFVTITAVTALTGYSERHIYRLEKEGVIPSRRVIGKRRTGWLKSEIERWMKNRPQVR